MCTSWEGKEEKKEEEEEEKRGKIETIRRYRVSLFATIKDRYRKRDVVLYVEIFNFTNLLFVYG